MKQQIDAFDYAGQICFITESAGLKKNHPYISAAGRHCLILRRMGNWN